jgi:hypothetical protein
MTGLNEVAARPGASESENVRRQGQQIGTPMYFRLQHIPKEKNTAPAGHAAMTSSDRKCTWFNPNAMGGSPSSHTIYRGQGV